MKPQDIIKYGTVEFLPHFKRNTYSMTYIIVVGCGGTGGRIIPLLAQHISNHNKTIAANPAHKEFIQHKMQLILVDADIVEGKNLKRQNFFEFDITKNKAQVFAERYSALMGLDIQFSPKFFDKFAEESSYQNEWDANFIIFDCTDNVNARRSIEAFGKECILISCGNEDTFGQVLVSTSGYQAGRSTQLIDTVNGLREHIRHAESCIRSEIPLTSKVHVLRHLPSLLELHPTFKDTVKPSCTEIELENDQSMPINSLVGQLAYNVFYKIISGQKLNYNLVRCNINNTFSTDFIGFPLHALNVFMKALFQDTGEKAAGLMKEMAAAKLQHTSKENILRIIDAYDVHAIVIAKAWIEYHRRFRTDPTLVEIQAKITELENKQRGI